MPVGGDPTIKYRMRDGSELTLDELVEKCRHIKPSIEQHRQMVRSFVYGNCNLDNPDVTYELVCRVEKEIFDASR